MRTPYLPLLIVPLLLQLAACGDNHVTPTPGPDLAVRVDSGDHPDQMASPDLTSLPDLAMPDLAAVPPDMTTIKDLATRDLTPAPTDGMMRPPCAPNAGYFGGKPDGGFAQCGQQGMCNGDTYALDCNGFTCICAFNKAIVQSFVQMMNTCNNLNDPWKNVCGF